MKKCVRCGAENNSEFKYCKLCGAELPCVDRKVYRETAYAEQTNSDFRPESEEITISEMAQFVDKNSGQIVPKFVWMQQRGKRLAWCLPAFLFGLFFGLPGAAIWFLYRKMTKPAVILLSVSALLSAVGMIFNFDIMKEYYTALFSATNYYNQLFATDPRAAMDWLGNYMNELSVWLSSAMAKGTPFIVSFISDYVAHFALPIITSLFALSVYKDFALGKISSIKRNTVNTLLYPYELRREGGVSVGRAVIGMAAYLAVTAIISLIPFIAALAG